MTIFIIAFLGSTLTIGLFGLFIYSVLENAKLTVINIRLTELLEELNKEDVVKPSSNQFTKEKFIWGIQ